MATVREVYQYLDGLAPFSLQMSFDNAGFLVGRGSAQVTRILVSLDITEEVAAEAVELGAETLEDYARQAGLLDRGTASGIPTAAATLHTRSPRKIWGQLLLLMATPVKFIRNGPSLYALMRFSS